jgi:hypothetical protein
MEIRGLRTLESANRESADPEFPSRNPSCPTWNQALIPDDVVRPFLRKIKTFFFVAWTRRQIDTNV